MRDLKLHVEVNMLSFRVSAKLTSGKLGAILVGAHDYEVAFHGGSGCLVSRTYCDSRGCCLVKHDRSHRERCTADLSEHSHSVDRLDSQITISSLDIVGIETSLLNLNVAAPDIVKVPDKLLAIMPDVASVRDPARLP